MAYTVYLLDISQWLQVNEEKQNTVDAVGTEKEGLLLWQESAKRTLELLCRERAEKVLRNRTPKGQAHSLGAGLLLQYIWQIASIKKQTADKLTMLRISELLDILQTYPVAQLPLVHGANGKPYFANSKLYFSLSHSGDYVLCAVSDDEIGADIQECRVPLSDRLVKRVLSGAELEEWNALASDTVRAITYFYQKWTEKEARGKLTGEGILDELDKKKQHVRDIHTENDFLLPGYCISVCRYSKIKN